MNIFDKIHCRFRNHSEITDICFNKDCQLKRLCCVECINTFHKDHLDNLISIDSVNSFIQQESKKQDKCFNPYSQSWSQLLQGLNDLKHIVEMFKGLAKENIEKYEQHTLQNYILKQSNKQGTIEDWTYFIEGMVQFIEIDKSVLKYNNQGYKLNKKEEKQLQIIRQANKSLEETINSFNNPVFQKQLEFQLAHIALRGHQGLVNGVDISKNRTIIASCSSDKSVKLWDYKTKKIIKNIQNEWEVYQVAISSNDQYLASGGKGDFSIQLYDLKQNQNCEPLIGHKDKIRSIIFSMDSQLLFSGGMDKQVIIWNLSDKKPIFSLQSDSVIQKIICSLDNQLFSFICSESLQIWSLQDKIKLIHEQKPHSPGFGLCSTKDSSLFVTCGDGSIKTWKFNDLGNNQKSLTLTQSINDKAGDFLKIIEATIQNNTDDKKLLSMKGVIMLVKLLGFALHELERYDQAIECYNQTLKIDPKDIQALNSMGINIIQKDMKKQQNTTIKSNKLKQKIFLL